MVFQTAGVWHEPLVRCAQQGLSLRWDVAMQPEVLVTPLLCPSQILPLLFLPWRYGCGVNSHSFQKFTKFPLKSSKDYCVAGVRSQEVLGCSCWWSGWKLDMNSEIYIWTVCILFFFPVWQFSPLAEPASDSYINKSYSSLMINVNYLNLSAEMLFRFRILCWDKQKENWRFVFIHDI